MSGTANANERPIVIRRVKKVVGGGHHGGAWKVAYADFVTAMMAFFMLLWLISSPDEEMLHGLAEYFSPGASTEGSGGAEGMMSSSSASGLASTSPARAQPASGVPSADAAVAGVARGGTAQIPDASLRVVAEELRLALELRESKDDSDRNVEMEQTPDALRITLMDTAKRPMFLSGTAELNAYARGVLARIAKAAGNAGVQIAIEGHTDGAGGLGGDNWRLSGDRARSAHRAMKEAGLAEGRFERLVAMANSRPLYPDQPDRPENRRITVILEAKGSSLPSDASFRF